MSIDTLPLESAIMFAVAAVLALAGAWMLFQLRRPLSPGRTYAYRMTGIMALSGGAVLGMSAAAMWQWSASP
ncbi:hypothetical protein [Sphingomonas corticis]|jgi:hypothetical protein|uniref:Uncharacterized protein n=1 Tax=Sphingomonas corticis TaxID=2722791 RepID=A0ABX1CQW2_9SPHN|nr:hypothetical protein [Sphingomonas corticis]NJR78122.1 hypothetical protein [Sphingomonas corticis]